MSEWAHCYQRWRLESLQGLNEQPKGLRVVRFPRPTAHAREGEVINLRALSE